MPDIEVTSEPDGQVWATLTEAGLRAKATSAVEQSIEIVRRRIDETGVSEALIARQGQSRILVTLPGVEDPNRIKELLGRTARMTFHLVDENARAGIDAAAGRDVPARRTPRRTLSPCAGASRWTAPTSPMPAPGRTAATANGW